MKPYLASSSMMVLALALAAFARPASATDSVPTFEQVLAAPDDADLGIAYARNEAQNGHLLNAAAALERILMSHPNASSVRLLYVAVLYRLNDLAEARQQLKEIDTSHLSALQSAEYGKFRRLIDHGQAPTKITGDVIAGVDAESDVIAALLQQTQFISGHHFQANGATMIGAGDIALSHDLDLNGDYTLLTSASIYSRTSFEGPNADFAMGDFRLGIGSASPSYDWQVGAVLRDYMLFSDPYLVQYGAIAQGSWHQSMSLTWNASLEVDGQSFHEPPVFGGHGLIDDPQNGPRIAASVGAAYRLDAYSTFALNLGYDGAWASYGPYGYDAEYLNLDYHALLGRGAYFDSSGDVYYYNYRGADPGLFNRRIEELRSDARLALGAPLSAFTEIGATGDVLENLILEGSVSIVDQATRLPIADYDSGGAQVRLIWKFGS
jgi:hypothetical protein